MEPLMNRNLIHFPSHDQTKSIKCFGKDRSNGSLFIVIFSFSLIFYKCILLFFSYNYLFAVFPSDFLTSGQSHVGVTHILCFSHSLPSTCFIQLTVSFSTLVFSSFLFPPQPSPPFSSASSVAREKVISCLSVVVQPGGSSDVPAVTLETKDERSQPLTVAADPLCLCCCKLSA